VGMGKQTLFSGKVISHKRYRMIAPVSTDKCITT
jgi:hypothetical protein